MKEKKTLRLNFWQKVTHYSIVPFLLLMQCFTVYYLIEFYVTKTYTGVRDVNESIPGSLFFLILSIAFIFIQRIRLKFKEIIINNSRDDFQEAIKRTLEDHNWKVENNNDNFFRAYHYDFLKFSVGEMITIIRQDDKILINSICDISNRPSIISFGWNKKNKHIFINNLINVVEKIPHEIIIEEEVFKWKFTDILQRVFIYGLSIFFLVISFCNLNSNGVFITRLFAVIIAGTYFYLVDYKLIKILRKKE